MNGLLKYSVSISLLLFLSEIVLQWLSMLLSFSLTFSLFGFLISVNQDICFNITVSSLPLHHPPSLSVCISLCVSFCLSLTSSVSHMLSLFKNSSLSLSLSMLIYLQFRFWLELNSCECYCCGIWHWSPQTKYLFKPSQVSKHKHNL